MQWVNGFEEGGCDWAGVLGLARGVVEGKSGFCVVVGLSPARSSTEGGLGGG